MLADPSRRHRTALTRVGVIHKSVERAIVRHFYTTDRSDSSIQPIYIEMNLIITKSISKILPAFSTALNYSGLQFVYLYRDSQGMAHGNDLTAHIAGSPRNIFYHASREHFLSL